MQGVLKDLRIEKGLSQAQLAKRLNVSQTAIAKWETGKSQPTASLIIAIADFFDVSTDYLLGLENDDGSRLSAAGMPASGFTESERQLLKDFRALNPQEQTQMLVILRAVKTGGRA
jgi:transcriptional regulator with XRE-family HTH domain